MRYLSLMFCLYFLSLSLIPCTDKPDNSIHAVAEGHESINSKHHETPCSNHDHQDECSPLCVCDCCHIHILFETNILATTLPEKNYEEVAVSYVNPISNHNLKSLFRPPQA